VSQHGDLELCLGRHALVRPKQTEGAAQEEVEGRGESGSRRGIVADRTVVPARRQRSRFWTPRGGSSRNQRQSRPAHSGRSRWQSLFARLRHLGQKECRRATERTTWLNIEFFEVKHQVAGGTLPHRTHQLARCSWIGPWSPFSSTEPTSTNRTVEVRVARITVSVTSTSPGPACAAILAAALTVRPK